jgi:hypothetical protein
MFLARSSPIVGIRADARSEMHRPVARTRRCVVVPGTVGLRRGFSRRRQSGGFFYQAAGAEEKSRRLCLLGTRECVRRHRRLARRRRHAEGRRAAYLAGSDAGRREGTGSSGTCRLQNHAARILPSRLRRCTAARRQRSCATTGERGNWDAVSQCGIGRHRAEGHRAIGISQLAGRSYHDIKKSSRFSSRDCCPRK